MIEVERRTFARAVDLALSVVERRNAIPALGGLVVRVNGDLTLQGSDLDTFTEVKLPMDGASEDFVLMEPARVLAAVKASGGQHVRFAASLTTQVRGQGTENERTVTNRQLRLTSGQLDATLHVGGPDDHPGAEAIAEELFSADLGEEVIGQIARIVPAISTEETRYYLNGICLRRLDEWTWRFAATDGHRLMMVDIPLPGAVGTIPDMTIIPRRWINIALARVRKARDGLRLTYGPGRVINQPAAELAVETTGKPRLSLSTELDGLRFTLTTKLIDGTYPEYARVIPQYVKFAARLARRDLARAINALSAIGSEKVRAVKLIFTDGQITCALKSADLGEGTYCLPANHNAPDGFEIGFNGQYLLDILGSLRGDEVELGLTDSGAATMITDPADTAFRAVLMPMRI